MSFFQKLKAGLGQSSTKLTQGVAQIFTHRKLEAESLEELEELLITSDLGVQTSAMLTEELGKRRFEKEISPEEVRSALAEIIEGVLAPCAKPLELSEARPTVILIVGVNGNGKTTTTAKLAAQYQAEGKKVMMAACDTFRAAAVEQLEQWANRIGCPLIKGAEGSDAASVAFQALERAKAENVDVLLMDTAGRLQNKQGLMEELAKIVRVMRKQDEAVPQHTLMVLDATTGQNALSQVKAFKEAVAITGLIVTKLDGSARGGVVVALAENFKLPIHAIGVGEGVDDLKPFDASAFAGALMGVA